MAVAPEEMVSAFQNYQDASYAQAERHLAPQRKAQQDRFQQMMVNKGLAPGSAAFNLAQAQMQRGQSDLSSKAAFDAMGFGLGAQEQAFGQDYKNRTMAMQKDQFTRNLGQRESEFGRGLGERGRQFDVGMSQRESEFGRNLGLQEGQAEFGNLMQMGDFGMRLADFTNRNRMQDYNMMEGMLAHAPGGQFIPMDTQAAYNASMTGASNVYNAQADMYGQTIGAIGNVAGAAIPMIPSALEFKILKGETPRTKRNMVAAKILTMPIYNWYYKPQFAETGDKLRFGALANDFNRHFINDEDEQTIDVQRYIAALHVTVQELFSEYRRLEQLLWHVAEAQGIPMDATQYKGKKFGKVFDIADKIDQKPEYWTPVGEA